MTSNKMYCLPDGWTSTDEATAELVSEMIGKVPQGEFQVVTRSENGQPSVIENAPFFYDGTPMPTRYWLVDPALVADISRLESGGAITRVQDEIDIDEIQSIHQRHKIERDLLILDSYEGPRPTGGVGGTRKGVKCLHTHVANYLASGDDKVGEWALTEIEKIKANQ